MAVVAENYLGLLHEHRIADNQAMHTKPSGGRFDLRGVNLLGLGDRHRYLPYMIPTPTEIFTRIKDGSLLHPAVVVRLDHDSILDERNGDANFEAQWMRCYNQIEDRWRSAEVKQDLAALIDDVRRESFLSVSRATAQHEIASYVSDDFDLIVRGAVLGINDDFLNRLWDAYNHNEILTPKNGK